MKTILAAMLAGALVCGDSWAAENHLLDDILQKGVAMPDGSVVKPPPPTMSKGLDAAGQRAAIAKIAGQHHPIEELLRNSIVAPFELDIRSIPTSAGTSPMRGVDLWFVAHGNWDALKSKDFLESLMSLGGSRATATQGARAGFLSQEALAKRGVKFVPKPGWDEGEYFAAVSMFDRVELTATRHVLITRQPDSLTIAARIDPRFNADSEYPNQWRSIHRDLNDPEKVAIGPPQVYASACFYGKITRLAEPAGAMFVEYHVVFEEPQGWFNGANLLRSKLPLVVQDVVRNFRRKLSRSSDIASAVSIEGR